MTVESKVEQEDKPEPEPKLSFPILARASTGKIVLFSSPCAGTVVKTSKKFHGDDPVGYCSGTWVSVDTKSVWTILDPEDRVILSNG